MLIESTRHLRKDWTATGYVVNPERTKLLVIFHKKLKKWLPAGGHMQPNELPHEAALREVFEETGVRAKLILDDPDMQIANTMECQIPRPYSVLYEWIPAAAKDVEHVHVDFIYAMEAEESDLRPQTEEVSHVKWALKAEIMMLDTFDSVKGFAQNMLT